MVPFLMFLTVYAVACSWFFIALVRWTMRSERTCSCKGAFSIATFVHGDKMCYPRAESASTPL